MPSNSFSNRLYKYFYTYPIYFIYIPLIVYWIFLFVITTLPTDKVPQLFDNLDKLEHFIAYAVLSYLLTLTLYFQKRSKLLSLKAYFFSMLFILLYAAVDELHQLFVPGRYCDFYDWCADSIGGLIGILFVYLFLRRQINISMNSVTRSAD